MDAAGDAMEVEDGGAEGGDAYDDEWRGRESMCASPSPSLPPVTTPSGVDVPAGRDGSKDDDMYQTDTNERVENAVKRSPAYLSASLFLSHAAVSVRAFL